MRHADIPNSGRKVAGGLVQQEACVRSHRILSITTQFFEYQKPSMSGVLAEAREMIRCVVGH